MVEKKKPAEEISKKIKIYTETIKITEKENLDFVDNLLYGKKARYIEIVCNRDCSLFVDFGDGFKAYKRGLKTDVPLTIISLRGIIRLQIKPPSSVTTTIDIFASSNIYDRFMHGSPVVKIQPETTFEPFDHTTTGAVAEDVHTLAMTSGRKISIAPVDAECYIRFDDDATTGGAVSLHLEAGEGYNETEIKIREKISVIRAGAANVNVRGILWG